MAGKKTAHKTSLAAGAQIDLEKEAQEQQKKIQTQMEKILTSVKSKHEEEQVRDKKRQPTSERNGVINATRGSPMHKKHTSAGQAEFNKVTGKVGNS